MDTNAVIEYIGNSVPPNGTAFIDNLPPIISVITRIELLGWRGATPTQLAPVQHFVNLALIHPLDEAVILQTIQIRQTTRIKTPDAIIAATALVHNHELISRNVNDFSTINGLTIIDPHSL